MLKRVVGRGGLPVLAELVGAGGGAGGAVPDLLLSDFSKPIADSLLSKSENQGGKKDIWVNRLKSYPEFVKTLLITP